MKMFYLEIVISARVINLVVPNVSRYSRALGCIFLTIARFSGYRSQTAILNLAFTAVSCGYIACCAQKWLTAGAVHGITFGAGIFG
jgi:hypothetical protein